MATQPEIDLAYLLGIVGKFAGGLPSVGEDPQREERSRRARDWFTQPRIPGKSIQPDGKVYAPTRQMTDRRVDS